MQSEGSLPRWQQLITAPYPELDEIRPHPNILFFQKY
jgi:hypothetical protein